ncbi:unnamed protein product [Rotaria sp. Silwood2]|nr:unnamed protein product [Rotaria sp. Silwood2]
MSKYPDNQKNLKKGLAEHNLTSDTPLTSDVLDSLVYVECVVREVLRFAPITVAVTRQATCDTTIDGIEIKKGDNIIIALQNLHRDPCYWKGDPSQFIPERFLNEDKNPPHCAFLTFGAGHRACAGQDLAFLELRTIVTRLMQRVKFLDPGTEADNSGGFIQHITCFPKHFAVRVIID